MFKSTSVFCEHTSQGDEGILPLPQNTQTCTMLCWYQLNQPASMKSTRLMLLPQTQKQDILPKPNTNQLHRVNLLLKNPNQDCQGTSWTLDIVVFKCLPVGFCRFYPRYLFQQSHSAICQERLPAQGGFGVCRLLLQT